MVIFLLCVGVKPSQSEWVPPFCGATHVCVIFWYPSPQTLSAGMQSPTVVLTKLPLATKKVRVPYLTTVAGME